MNDREVAVVIWLGIAVVFLVGWRDTRGSVRDVLAAALQPKLVVPVALTAAYASALLFVGARVGLWDPSLVPDTVAWFVSTAVVLLAKVASTPVDSGFFKTAARATLRAAVFVEVFVNLVVLSLPVELLLVPLLVLLGLLAAVARSDGRSTSVANAVDGIIACVGVALLGYVAVRLATGWETFDQAHALLQFLLPVWLTFGALPFVYGVGIWVMYDSAFARLNYRSERVWQRIRAKCALIRELRGNARDAGALDFYWAGEITEVPTMAEARAAVRRYVRSRRDTERAAAQEQDDLKRHAGVSGTTEDGRQVDQREFKETRAALRWIATAEMGWFRNDPPGYRADLVPMLEPFRDLPEAHGIDLHVDDAGGAWWASRRTITGWCFAIGAAGPPPDQWLYDGPDPPSGFPGSDPVWGERWGIEAKNW